MPITQKLEKVDPMLVDDFRRNFLSKQEPVVIKGGISDWPACKEWTDEYLLQYSGDAQVTLKSKSDYQYGDSRREDEPEAVVGLRKAIEYMSSDSSSDMTYVRETEILQKLPELRKDVIDPPYMPADTNPIGPLLWIGPSGTIAQMHWDPWNNLYGQVRGRKKFILTPHSQLHLTYPNVFDIDHTSNFDYIRQTRPQVIDKMRLVVTDLKKDSLEVTRENYRQALPKYLDREDIACLIVYLLDINNCHVDAGNTDVEQHPLFTQAQRIEVILEPGDLLFVPYCYLHYVCSLDPSISINWFFDQPTGEDDMYQDSVRIAIQHLEP